MNSDATKGPLTSDPKRSAAHALSGYYYQALVSLDAWITLEGNARLYLEGAEDIDLVSQGCATTVQVRETQTPISLGNAKAREAINNFWRTREANPGYEIYYRYMTRSAIGSEQGHPFGSGVRGLELWRKAVSDRTSAEAVRTYLVNQGSLDKHLRSFLETSPISVIQEQFLARICWDTAGPERDDIIERVKELLILHGHSQRIPVPPKECERVLDPLLREVFEVASCKDRRALTRAEFLRHFEQLTFVQVPAARAQALELIVNNAFAPFLGQQTRGLQFITSAPPNPPAVMFTALSRSSLIKQYESMLANSGFLNIYGSTGIGKSTLAKQIIAEAENRQWLWLPATSISVAELRFALRDAALLLRESTQLAAIVLDDLPSMGSEFVAIQGVLEVLIGEQREKGNWILTTSASSLPSTFCAATDISTDCLVNPPAFDEEEIAQLAQYYGCAEAQALGWSKIITLQTSGHPQLVHAMVLGLQRDGWPEVSGGDLLSTPQHVESVRDEALVRIAAQLSSSQRILLYRLSVYIGSFRRPIISHLTAHPERLADSADLAEPLIGPWIEPAGRDSFRLSTLLQQSAQKELDAPTISAVHRAIAQALLTYKEITVAEGGALLFHAFMAGSETEFISAAIGLINAPRSVWVHIAGQISWFMHIDDTGTQHPFQGRPTTTFLTRQLQFRIALEQDVKRAGKIIRIWESEVELIQDERTRVSGKLLVASQALIHVDIELPAQRVVHLLETIACGTDELKTFGLELPRLDRSHWERIAGSTDTVAILFAISLVRVKSRQALSEMMDALESCEPSVRERILSNFNTSELRASLFVANAWLEDNESVTPDWHASLDLLDRIARRFLEWQCLPGIHVARHAQAVVYDEFLGDAAAALRVLDEHEAEFGPTAVVTRDGRAKILFRQKRFREALEIWVELFPEWEREESTIRDPTQMLARRYAGIAAASLEEWAESSEHFRCGEGLARLDGKNWLAIGFAADAACSAWRAGQHRKAVSSLEKALTEAELTGDAAADPQSFVFRKLVGHMILRLTQDIRESDKGAVIEEIVPGMCSNPTPNPEIHQLSDSPFDVTWLHLAELEATQLGTARILFSKLSRLRKSPFPVARMVCGDLWLKFQLKSGRLDSLSSAVALVEMAGSAAKQHNLRGGEIWEPEVIGENRASALPFSIGTNPYLCALLAVIARKRDPNKFLQALSNAPPPSISPKNWSVWLDLMQDTIDAPDGALAGFVRNSKAHDDQRLLASILLSAGRSADIEITFYAHVLLWYFLKRSPWGKSLTSLFCDLVVEAWHHASQTPALLRTPRITVPSILEACTTEGTPKSKVATVLLAAYDAVKVRLGSSDIEELKKDVVEQNLE